jgi:hypothetical protein
MDSTIWRGRSEADFSGRLGEFWYVKEKILWGRYSRERKELPF